MASASINATSIVLGGLLLFRLATSGALGAQGASANRCCFVHTGHRGTCIVEPAEGETCESILKYLNSPGTVGKSYCAGSRMRGGWTQVDCNQPQGAAERAAEPK
jgi:hypothetical protein